MRRARSAGIASSTIAYAPACSSALASCRTRAAASSLLPCTRKPPNAWIDCGVRPTWPITGMPAPTMRRDCVGHLDAALELHRLGVAFLHQPAGGLERLLARDLEAHERHVDDDVRALGSPRDDAGVVGHLVERDGERAAAALARPCRASRRRAGCPRRRRRGAAPSSRRRRSGRQASDRAVCARGSQGRSLW